MKIVTLTLSPALDKSTSIQTLEPESKLRCDWPLYQPGGGGINVARVIRRLGGEAIAVFAAGGPTGAFLTNLLQDEGIPNQPIPTEGWTRENLTVFVKSIQRQYRFVMPGADIQVSECNAFLEYVKQESPNWIIASGSLPKGTPEDFFAQLSVIAKARHARLIVDTSGVALKKALDTGVYLLKPNLRELGELTGKGEIHQEDQESAALGLIESGKCEIVVVSLGARGAMLASKAGIYHVTPPTVMVKSTVGAGDSMVAGLVWGLSQGWSHDQVLKYGVACGTATTMNVGTELCHKHDIENIFKILNR